jgi:mono/diheme cytochrome c family protein
MKLAAAITGLAISFAAISSSAASVDYVREVKPILARHCVSCHGAIKPRGDLRLDTAALAKKGGKDGPCIVPGSAEESALIEVISADAGEDRMPLKRPPLSDKEIATLRAWIDQGAKAPTDEAPSKPEATHWAFVAPQRPAVPQVSDAAWAVNPIDSFVRARLDKAGISPSPEADRITLIRRVSLDLTGLPPTPSEVEAFLGDARPDAYERVVERLLASPHFGERWARPWLDLARYADSNGYSIDAPRSIWKYRDWVIGALNRDQPFDEFVVDQLAGDLRPGATLAQRVATGFHRNTPINQEGGIDLEQFRVESVVDRVNTTATAFLGLTLGCAQCHDHKYDPISQREYYQFFAFFNSVDEPEVEFASDADKARREAVRREIAAYHDKLTAGHPEIVQKELEWEKTLKLAFKQGLEPALKDAFDRPIEKRTESQWRGLYELFLSRSPDYRAERAAIKTLRAREPKFETSMVVQERKTPRPTFIHIGGDFTRHGAQVTPSVPAVLPPLEPAEKARPTRLDLARWLVDPDNPLTARVTVNRFWQAYFGRGLVETENDFGTQGAPPSHPELLDWLASELVARGWSTKTMHRQIVTSRTYRQSSRARRELAQVDPANRLMARQSRLRLDAEAIRDSALAVSGLLSAKIGGPSVFPPQPEGVMTLGQMNRPWVASTGPDRHRRGLYTFFWRATPFPGLTDFDAPNAIQACTRRNRSNTPIQALTLLNDLAFVECAQALATRMIDETDCDENRRIECAFRLCVGRAPTTHESATVAALLDDERAESGEGSSRERSAWTTAARVLLNLDEFITRE